MDKIVYSKKILVLKRKIPKIAQAVGCCEAAVYNALAFKTNSQLAKDVRDITIRMYGGVLVPRFPDVVDDPKQASFERPQQGM